MGPLECDGYLPPAAYAARVPAVVLSCQPPQSASLLRLAVGFLFKEVTMRFFATVDRENLGQIVLSWEIPDRVVELQPDLGDFCQRLSNTLMFNARHVCRRHSSQEFRRVAREYLTRGGGEVNVTPF